MKKTLLALLGAALLLTGCAGMQRPSDKQLAMADYGPPLTIAEAEKKVIAHFATTLIDPYSAMYRASTVPPAQHWMSDNAGNYYFGYITPFVVNAKNRYGGYTGEQRYLVIFYKGEVFRVVEVSKTDSLYPDPYVFAPSR